MQFAKAFDQEHSKTQKTHLSHLIDKDHDTCTPKSPNTSQQLGKYIANGLDILSLSDMKISIDKHQCIDEDASTEDLKSDGLFEYRDLFGENADTGDNVYLSSIYEIYSKLNMKVDKLFTREYFDKTFMKQILEEACIGNAARIRGMICKEMRDRDPLFDVNKYQAQRMERKQSECKQMHYMTDGCSMIKDVQGMMDDAEYIAKIGSKLRRMYAEAKREVLEVELNLSRTCSDLTKQLDACSRELAGRDKEIEALKANEELIINSMRQMSSDSCNGMEMTSECDYQNELHSAVAMQILSNARNEYMDMKQSVERMKQRIDELHQENLGMKETIENYKQQVGKNEETKKELEILLNENIRFSEAITKLCSKNSKTKNDLITARDMLKQANEAIKSKNATISKQKNIIDVLQSRVGEEYLVPMNELQERVDDLKTQINQETNVHERDRLGQQIEDYERRIADFLCLIKRN
ncbi:hypothetical protein CWI40_121000 [Ordospora colligata]|nr:hypothetical protein CWI40_121000 [Ordospora colligata]